MTTTKRMNKISIIGLGPMGQAMAHVFLEKGYTTTIWNRTKSKAEALVKRGADLALTIEEVLNASPLTIICLTDYNLMYKVLDSATDALAGKIIVNLSSDTPEKSRQAADWAANKGAHFLAGGIMADPPLVGKPESYVLYSGDESVFKSCEPLLQHIGRADYLGSDPGLASLFYQAQLEILFTSAAGILHSLALIKSANIPAGAFEKYLNESLTTLPYFFKGMAEEADKAVYNGERNNMQMMAATTLHIAQTSKGAKVSTKLPEVINEIFQETVNAGFGKDGLTSIIEILKKPKITNNGLIEN